MHVLTMRSVAVSDSSFYRTWWCMSIAMFVWASLAGQAGPFGAVLGISFWTPIARLTFGTPARLPACVI